MSVVETIESIIKFIALTAGIIYWLAKKIGQAVDAQAARDESVWDQDEADDDWDRDDDSGDDGDIGNKVIHEPGAGGRQPDVPVPVHLGGRTLPEPGDPFADERAELTRRIDILVADAEQILSTARVDWATQRVAEVLHGYVIPRARSLRARVAAGNGMPDGDHYTALGHVMEVRDAVAALIEQRRTRGLREALGDADALARACYEPILDFAGANRIAITTADPVTLLTRFDLGIWVGFIPTGVAPIFLPPQFFSDIRWWPAIGHEIGHDFFAAARGVDVRLRQELGLPSEAVGTRPLVVRGGMKIHEVLRVFGGFFEEIFCDVVGTMMFGPAYGYTMLELFAEPKEPERVVTVAVDPSGTRYGTHPPRQLRVKLAAQVLDLMGEDQAAREIMAEWTLLHGEPREIVIPTMGGAIGVPIQIMERFACELVEHLYQQGTTALDGHPLAAIPGLDYGPHEAAESRRARDALLAGKVPAQQRSRAVIAGAVLAWRAARGRQAEIIALARRAIVGVSETREDTYAQRLRPGMGKRELREAFLLHTMLAPPLSLRRMRPGRAGFLARPGQR